MARPPAIIRLTAEEEAILREWCGAEPGERQLAERANIVLMSSRGYTLEQIAAQLDTRPARVSKWRQRFAQQRLFGLSDRHRAGAPARYDSLTESRLLALLKQPAPNGHTQWTGGLLAASLGDVSADQVWRILRRHDIRLSRQHSWSISTAPEFTPKAADIVGLYLNPPESALVLCVGENPAIQGSDGATEYVRLTNGKAARNLSGESDGTTTISAALDVIIEQVQAGHTQHRCRRQFLDFMNDIVAYRRAQTIHVILSSLNTRKAKWDRWLREHPRVFLHSTPTYLSWLNQVECWVSILSRTEHSQITLTPERQLREGIESFAQVYTENATPFEWLKVLTNGSVPEEAYS
jgi:hypothetical protein